jgi:hypothetical protein
VNPHDFDALVDAVHRSLLGKVAARAARHCTDAWRESRVAAVLSIVTNHVRSWSAADRLRAAALIAAWVLAGQVAALTWLPRYVMSGLPRFWFAGLAAAALLIAVFAAPLQEGWRDSRLAGYARRLTAARRT